MCWGLIDVTTTARTPRAATLAAATLATLSTVMGSGVMVSSHLRNISTFTVHIHCPPDIDECRANTSSCQQVCVNTPGSYTCQCRVGFSLNTDGTTCAGMFSLRPICTCISVVNCSRYQRVCWPWWCNPSLWTPVYQYLRVIQMLVQSWIHSLQQWRQLHKYGNYIATFTWMVLYLVLSYRRRWVFGWNWSLYSELYGHCWFLHLQLHTGVHLGWWWLHLQWLVSISISCTVSLFTYLQNTTSVRLVVICVTRTVTTTLGATPAAVMWGTLSTVMDKRALVSALELSSVHITC